MKNKIRIKLEKKKIKKNICNLLFIFNYSSDFIFSLDF